MRKVLCHWVSIGLLIAPAAFAHDPTVPAQCIQTGTRPIIVAHFSFSPAKLHQDQIDHLSISAPIGAEQRTSAPPSPGSGVCGQEMDCGIPDEWASALRTAREFCASSANTNGYGPEKEDITGPENFLDPENHHRAYRFTDGNLTGACYICVSSTEVPAL